MNVCAPLWESVQPSVLSVDHKNAKMKLVCELQLSKCMHVPSQLIDPVDPEHTIKANMKAGQVLQQEPQVTNIVRIVTWSTTLDALNEVGNSSHAERQLCNWLLSDQQAALRLSIISIQINNVNFSPCSDCARQLVGLLNSIKSAQRKASEKLTQQRTGPRQIVQTRPLPDVKTALSWSKLYPGSSRAQYRNRTTWAVVRELRNGKWSLYAPKEQWPEDDGQQTEDGKPMIEKCPPNLNRQRS
jgi:hypothetical protein